MNLKAFFVDALQSALELGIGAPEDVLRHVTPDLLAQHLPRPLWARLLTACMGAPRVDAQLVVETIGVPNLCEHVPSSLIWACVAEMAARSLAKSSEAVAPVAPVVTTKSGPVRAPLAPPPPEAAPIAPVRASPSSPVPGPAIPSPVKEQPLSEIIDELEEDERPATPPRGRVPTSQRFRQSSTGISRPLGTSGARRPQAQATPAVPPARIPPRRGSTDAEHETETHVDGSDWRNREPIAVDDSQLVDWQTETTANNDDDFGRKR